MKYRLSYIDKDGNKQDIEAYSMDLLKKERVRLYTQGNRDFKIEEIDSYGNTKREIKETGCITCLIVAIIAVLAVEVPKIGAIVFLIGAAIFIIWCFKGAFGGRRR